MFHKHAAQSTSIQSAGDKLNARSRHTAPIAIDYRTRAVNVFRASCLVLAAVSLILLNGGQNSALAQGTNDLHPTTRAVAKILSNRFDIEDYDNGLVFDDFIYAAVNAFNSGQKERFYKDIRFLRGTIEKLSLPDPATAEYPEDLEQLPIYDLQRFLAAYASGASQAKARVSSEPVSGQRVVRIEFDESDLVARRPADGSFNTLAGWSSRSGARPGTVYRLGRDGGVTQMLGQIPGSVALPEGQARIRVLFVEQTFGTSYYDLSLDVTENYVAITDFEFEDGGTCWMVTDEEKRDLRAIGRELVGSRSVASTDQPLIIRYREWGRATCAAMIAFGSRKYYALKLVSSPEGAVVNIDGTDFGTTPNELMIRRNQPELNVIFRKEGFADAAFNLDLDEMEESENLEIEAVLLAEEP